MLEPLVDLMGAAAGRCDYADARWVERSSEAIAVVDGAIEAVDTDDEEGVGIRVRVGSGWGFACTQALSRAGLEQALDRALALAAAQPQPASAPGLAAVPPAQGGRAGPDEVDPFGVSPEEKIGVLLAADEAMAGDPRIVRRRSSCFAQRTVKVFASTEGAAVEQSFVECGGEIAAVAVADGELQVRTYPSAHGGDVAQAGWEHVRELDLPGHGA